MVIIFTRSFSYSAIYSVINNIVTEKNILHLDGGVVLIKYLRPASFPVDLFVSLEAKWRFALV